MIVIVPFCSWRAMTSLFARSCIREYSSIERIPFLSCRWAAASSGGRKRLPTWSARNGGAILKVRSVMAVRRSLTTTTSRD